MGWKADRTDLTADSTLITADGYEPESEECVWTADSTEVTADSTAQTADGYDPYCECSWSADSTLVTADSTLQTADGLDRDCSEPEPEDDEPYRLGLGPDDEYEELMAQLRREDDLILRVIKEFVRQAA